jgi:hypothetical protein
MSTIDFLDKLPSNRDGRIENMGKGSTLTSFELPTGLRALAKDMSQPNLLLQLTASYSLTRSELEYLQFNIFAKESSYSLSASLITHKCAT